MKKIFGLILVGLLASVFIFYKFPNLPKYLAYDEVQFSQLALSLKNKPYIAYSPLATGHSTLYFYIILFSFNIFGITNFALRFPAAIFGVLSVIIFYLIMKGTFQQLNNKTMRQFLPFILALILLSSRWFINFARFSFEATFLLFLELTSIYFLIKFQEKVKMPFLRQSPGAPLGVRRSKKKISNFFYLMFSGVFSGLAFISYTPGRIFFLLPMLFLLFRKQFNNLSAGRQGETIKQLLLFLIPFIIITAPLNLYFLKNQDSRIDQQFFLKNHEMPISEKISGLWRNISSTALMFNIKGDVNGRHNYPLKPALNPIIGTLFIIGLGISIKNWKKNINSFAILYFLLSIFPALMTYPWENPNMLRTFTTLPSIVFFVGTAIISFDTIVSKLMSRISHKKKYVFYLLFLLIMFSSFYEMRTYFKYQPDVFDQAFEMKKTLPSALSEPNPYEKSH